MVLVMLLCVTSVPLTNVKAVESNLIPDDAVEFNGHYYKAYDISMSWTDAKAYCESLGGHLVTITSQEEQTFIEEAFLTNNPQKTFYLAGGSRSNSNSAWTWVTGESFGYSNWGGDFNEEGEQHNNKTQNYIWIGSYSYKFPFKWVSHDNYNYDDSIWNTNKCGFICEWEEETEPIEFNGNYYKVYTIKKTWADAKAFCESLGGHLATITGEEENNFIMTLTGDNYCFLGGTDASSEGSWTWVTGENWSYSNWMDGEPNNGSDQYDGQNWLAINGNGEAETAGKWDDAWSDAQYFICEWEGETTKIEKGTFYGTYESSTWVVTPNDSMVSEITVDGDVYKMNSFYSNKIDLINNESEYKNKKVVIVVEDGEVVWLYAVSDIASKAQINVTPSYRTITYNKHILGKDYSVDYIDLTVRVSNTKLVDFPGDIDVLYSIPELSITLDSLNMYTSNSQILNFDGDSSKKIEFSQISIPIGKTETIDATIRVDVNEKYKIPSDAEEKIVDISCVSTTYKNGKEDTVAGYVPITVSNLEYKKPNETSASGNYEVSDKKIKELAGKLRRFIENSEIIWSDFSILDSFDIFDCFNANELKSIEAELFYCIVSVKSIEKTWENNLVDKLLLSGLDSDWFKVTSNSVSITKAKNIESYGNAKIVITCDYVELAPGCYKGDIYYEIIGQKTNRPKERAAFFVEADVDKFYKEMNSFAKDLMPGWSATGDVFGDAFDTIFNKTLRGVLIEAGYDNLLDMTMQGISFMKKRVVSYCPVDINVYNSSNELVACIENNEVVLSTENAQASVEGDTKIIWLFDDNYRIEYVSLAEFDMKVVVEEYGSSESHLRTTTIEHIPLKVGTSFEQTIDNTILEDTDYSLISNDGTKYSPTSDVFAFHEHTTEEELELIRDAGCTEYGFYCGLCSICNEWFKVIIEETGHTPSEWITDLAPTCTAEGSKHIECTVCEEVLETEAIEKLPHNYSSVVTEATCEEGGYTTYTCSCGDTYTGDKTSATGHNYVEGVCENCGESKVDNCTHLCHKSGFLGFIWKIVRFIIKLFRVNPVCDCGMSHY